MCFFYSSVRRTKQIGLNILCCIFHIFQIFIHIGKPAIFVLKRMVTGTMTGINNTLENSRMFFYVIPDAKKSSFYFEPVECIQYKFRSLRNRSVIESKIYFLIITGNVPGKILIISPQQIRRPDRCKHEYKIKAPCGALMIYLA